MKNSSLLLAVIALTLVSLTNPMGSALTSSINVKFVDRDALSIEDTIPLLVESGHELQPDEILSLSSFGVVTTIAGPVAVLHTNVRYLTALERLSFLSRIERPHSLSVYLDRSVPDIGADQVWREIKDPYGRNVTGAGIVIGIVDTGIDVTHPDFTFPNGSTKILYVWDQTVHGRPPTRFGYGYECTSSDIQQRTCPEVDTFGHGTHVAGIAASSGQATGRYSGVAPEATIIFVKSGHEVCNGGSWAFYASQILDGVNYIVKKASQLGRRAVISLSLGGNIGGHDGTDPLELGLDSFVEAGTPVVVAAGNSAQDNAHVRGELSQGRNTTVNIQVRPTTTDLQIDIWYPKEDQFNATLTAPDGETFNAPTPPRGSSSQYGNITALTSSSALGKELFFEVNSTTSLPTQIWKLSVQANKVNQKGAWDAWVDTWTCTFPGAFFLPGDEYEIDPRDTIGIPGTARFVVTVGAYITKTSWIGMNGQIYGKQGATGGNTSFSSLGPTRDGRAKPDIAAPGMLIASARSSSILKGQSDPDPFHRVLAGTSMAAPHVAGTIALMLQYKPELPATEIPEILQETARLDAYTDLMPGGSPIWGFGKIDARTATGFFRVTLITNGIPGNVKAPVRVDDKESFETTGSSWNYLYFLRGTTHAIATDAQLQGTAGTRYLLSMEGFIAKTNSLKMLNYTAQYSLTVYSQYGSTTGSGWYDANTTAKIGAPARIKAPGFLGYIGAEYILIYMITEDGKIVPDTVIMDRPRSVTAFYVITYPTETFIILSGGLVIITAASIGILARRRKRVA